jgi:hypothetical protein
LLAEILLFLLALALLLIFILGIVLFRKYVLPRCNSIGKLAITYVQNKLMFNSVLRALLQIYLSTAISTCISYFKMSHGFKENLLIVIPVTLFLVSMPIFTQYFLDKNIEELSFKRFKSKYGSLYQNVNTFRKYATWFTTLFLVRRLIFACVIAFVQFSVVAQIAIVDACSTILLAFYLSVRPMNGGSHNFIQIFNETMFLLIVQSLFLFTNYVTSPIQRYFFG